MCLLQVFQNYIRPIISFLSLVTLVIAAIASCRASRASQKAAVSTEKNTIQSSKLLYLQVMNDLVTFRFSNETRNARKTLWDWLYKNGKENFANKYKKLLDSRNNISEEIDSARRTVKLYFEKVYSYHKNDLLTEKQLYDLISIGELDLFFKVYLPLEKKLAEHIDERNEKLGLDVYERPRFKGLENFMKSLAKEKSYKYN